MYQGQSDMVHKIFPPTLLIPIVKSTSDGDIASHLHTWRRFTFLNRLTGNLTTDSDILFPEKKRVIGKSC